MKKAYILWVAACVLVAGAAGVVVHDYPRAAQALGVALLAFTAAAGIVLYGSGRRS